MEANLSTLRARGAARPTGDPVDHHGEISYREVGDGQCVLFLHGMLGGRGSWEAQLSGLCDRWRCVAWDMPGYGGSSPLPEVGFPELADAVVRLLDDLEVERAHLVGLAAGGMVALHTAVLHPERVDRLALVDSSPAFGLDGTDPVEWRRDQLARIAGMDDLADIAADVVTELGGPGLFGPALLEQVESMASIPADTLRRMIECVPTHDVREHLEAISHPTLVLVGERDRQHPVSYSATLAWTMPSATLHVVPKAGHLTPAERPDEFNALLRQHLRAGSSLMRG